MAEAKVDIITVDAVTNLESLRKAISDAKKNLSTLQIGSEDYRTQLIELNKAQNLLTNAVNGTTATEEDYQKALNGTSKTYNTLVKQMADMKKALRNIDVSTEEGAASFQKLAGEINAVNDELKAMDAMKGDFGRNVGDYYNQISKAINDLPPGLKKVQGPLNDVNASMAVMSKQPIIGIIGLLVPLITKITDELKENKTAMDAVKKLTKSFEPVLKVVQGVLQKIADWVAEAMAGLAKFVKTALPQLKNIISGIMGVGNAIFQFLIWPIKQSIEAFKGLGNIIRDVFTGQWDKIKDDAKNAVKGINEAFKKGFDFKGNYEAGEKAGAAAVIGRRAAWTAAPAASTGASTRRERR